MEDQEAKGLILSQGLRLLDRLLNLGTCLGAVHAPMRLASCRAHLEVIVKLMAVT